MNKLATLSIAALLCSCGGTQKTNGDPDQEPVTFEDPPEEAGSAESTGADPTKPAHLKLVAMVVSDGGATRIALAEDGSIQAGGQTLGKLTAAGEFLHPNGALLASLNPDGTIKGAHLGDELFADMIVADDGGVTQAGNPLMTVTPDPEATETPKAIVQQGGQAVLIFEGPAEGRRAAMFFIQVIIQARKAGAPPSPETEAPPDAEPAPEPEAESAPAPADAPTPNPCG